MHNNKYVMNKVTNALVGLFALIILSSSSCEKKDYELDQDFNSGWAFNKGDVDGVEDIDFDDSNWRKVTLPHDWAIEGPFSNEYNARTGGLPVHGIGWYRKHFTVDEKHVNKIISIEFDGVMSNSEVWVNGNHVGTRPNGYIGFEYDITKYINLGKVNVIVVKAAPEDLGARWYTGAGIYRNVRLKINNKVHIPQYGTYITTPKITSESAIVNIETSVVNNTNSETSAHLVTCIIDPNGVEVAKSTKDIIVQKGKTGIASVDLAVKAPILWEIYQPNLYKTVSEIVIKGEVVDHYETTFGIRDIEFSRDKGFQLNGKTVKLEGVCMHHDQGALGAAINYRAKERQIEIMKSMGVNAIRTSHNPPSPELLQICDKMGIVVQVEAFDEWKLGKVENGYHKYFDMWHERDLTDMIKRDRNHACVIMWSIGNEILEQSRKDGWKLTKHLNDICHRVDPTRPTTAGFNYFPAPFKNKLANYIDIVGMNYWPLNYQEILDENPNMIVYGSETSSQTSSRGVYHLPIEPMHQHSTNHVSSYDGTVGPPWAYPPDVEFEQQEKVTSSLGEFMWTGIDYLGEPTPYGGRDNSTNGYWNDDWPSRSSYFAPVDLAGFPKDRYYLYQSQWTEEPMVHVLPHWNWEGKEGDIIPVYSYTNCDEVELFVNGKSMGKKVKGFDLTPIPAEFHFFEKGTYESKYRLSWEVPYQAGNIKVVAYKDGKAEATKVIHTAGKPDRIELEVDRDAITADGTDLSFITARILDKDGNFCPMADNRITFSVEGFGILAATDNGDQTSLESFQADNKKAFNGMCLAIIKATNSAGTINVKASAKGISGASISIVTK